jgi:beta-galactosidase
MRFTSLLILLLSFLPLRAQRQTINIDGNWWFRFSHQVQKNSGQRVDLPHTWNAVDALSGKADYKRGIGNYTRTIFVPDTWRGRRLFVRFEGANSIADVFVNGKHIGEHRGGYEAFIFELTDKVDYGKDNTLLVRVNNAEQLDVMPLVGDFNFYGGIYRDVNLLLTAPVCISPLDYASPGVYLRQQRVDSLQAQVIADVMLANAADKARDVRLQIQVTDGARVVCEQSKTVKISPLATAQKATMPLLITRPHLWNATADPFMYTVKIALWSGSTLLDTVTQPLGLRYYRVDPDKGFFLNGKHLALHGVCRHQERAEVGNALRPWHHEEDVRLMREMGVNAVRLAHYPQSAYTYQLMDEAGIVTWAEIPFVGPGGYADKGFVDMESFRENGKQQLREMIRQHYNHPSICFWGMFNELKYDGDNPVEYVKELNALAHFEDATRLTTCASNQDGDLNFITDVMAWNRYDGWYRSNPAGLATYIDEAHAKYPKLRIAISEYGAGASIYHQQDSLVKPDPTGWWHPENWQTYYHIRNWQILSSRPYVWGTFVWNMFDFGAAHRTEGDRPGINDKGLVTHDRKVCKDAFYFYKANWNPEPMVYIAGKRNVEHHSASATLWVFSNCPSVTLNVNGTDVQTLVPDATHLCTFDITLRPGKNVITARTPDPALQDTSILNLENKEFILIEN